MNGLDIDELKLVRNVVMKIRTLISDGAMMRTGAGAMALSLLVVSCAAPTPTAQNSPVPSPTTSSSPKPSPSSTPAPVPDAPSPKPTSTPFKTSANSLTTTGSTVPIAIYRMDSGCDALVPKTEDLPKEKTLDAAVGAVIRHSNSADFTISDYGITKEGNIATIVLRLPPTSKRPFAAMSACEQMSLFGALRATIVGRSDWNIRDVQFSDGKKEIEF
jgi:hypothetical protein